MKRYLCSWIGRLNTIDMAVLPNYLQIQCNPTAFFVEIDKLVLKCIMEVQRTQKSQNNVGKQQSWRTNTLSESSFKTYYQATVIKTVWFWRKDRHIDQWNGIESPEIDSYIYSQLIFNKDANTI